MANVVSARAYGVRDHILGWKVWTFEIDGRLYQVVQTKSGYVREVRGPKGQGFSELRYGTPKRKQVEAVFAFANHF